MFFFMNTGIAALDSYDTTLSLQASLRISKGDRWRAWTPRLWLPQGRRRVGGPGHDAWERLPVALRQLWPRRWLHSDRRRAARVGGPAIALRAGEHRPQRRGAAFLRRGAAG